MITTDPHLEKIQRLIADANTASDEEWLQRIEEVSQEIDARLEAESKYSRQMASAVIASIALAIDTARRNGVIS